MNNNLETNDIKGTNQKRIIARHRGKIALKGKPHNNRIPLNNHIEAPPIDLHHST
jgi:hypothetical protein